LKGKMITISMLLMLMTL